MDSIRNCADWMEDILHHVLRVKLTAGTKTLEGAIGGLHWAAGIEVSLKQFIALLKGSLDGMVRLNSVGSDVHDDASRIIDEWAQGVAP